MLFELAHTDSDADVRINALWALTQYFGGDPETRTVLLDRARTDPEEQVRRSAILRWVLGYSDWSYAVLLSRDLDGMDPGIDPHAPVDMDRVQKAAAKLGMVEEEVRRAYEEIAEELPLRLVWKDEGVAVPSMPACSQVGAAPD